MPPADFTTTSEDSCARPALDMTTLGHPFTPVPPEHAEYPAATIALHDRLAAYAPELTAQYAYASGRFQDVDFKRHLHSVPFRYLAHLSSDELAKVWCGSVIMMSFDQMFNGGSSTPSRELPPQKAWPMELRLLGKIRSSMWRWGYGEANWNGLLTCFEAMQRFDFGIPGFTVTLDYTTGSNERGYSEFSRTYLDGVFGYLVHYKGKHVLTIGWSYSAKGEVLLAQIQLKSPKGNRWCFGLGKPLLEHVLDRMHLAFPDSPILLVDGQALAERVSESYATVREAARQEAERNGTLAPQVGPTIETISRIAQAYSRPMDSWHRSGETTQIGDLLFHPMQRIPTFERETPCPEASETKQPNFGPAPKSRRILAAR